MPSSLFLPLVNIYLTCIRGHGSMCCSCFVLADTSNKFWRSLKIALPLFGIWALKPYYLGPKALYSSSFHVLFHYPYTTPVIGSLDP